MFSWAPNQYRRDGSNIGISENVIEEAILQASEVSKKKLPPIFTLGHLAFYTNVSYKFLREIVKRIGLAYRVFKIKKRRGGYRYINVPNKKLMMVQRWIDKFVLSNIQDSPYSYAFSNGSSIVKCARKHLGATWLIKIDLRNFFESISEKQVYSVFEKEGYNKLVSFELTRICTRVLLKCARKYSEKRWRNDSTPYVGNALNIESTMQAYYCERIGHLPQGAPTSPKLANLVMRELDYKIANIATTFKLEYTRYADDITLSTSNKDFSREKCKKVITQICRLLPKHELSVHSPKTKILPPGARKIVLGLLVDGDEIKLPKSYRLLLERHMYFINKDISSHVEKTKFNSEFGLKNYMRGKIAFVRQVDEKYYQKLIKKYGKISWPI